MLSLKMRKRLLTNLRWGGAYYCQVWWGEALEGEAPVVVEVVGLSWD